ncbi:hypothetical protein FJTKL_14675 [Diaporthe vaccinii]|uniref:Uncharacterized protein n=1 Tax=Diaporthe vaccinii TaxID=105482 RepID=A0ABR4F7I4_9PEZI
MRVHEPRKAGKKKRKKPGDQIRTKDLRRGGDFSSAREVMDNFNSKSILSDRITMQPTVRPGLFDNGRASKNQLPDLTFHEMHFLKRPPPPKPVSRGRERAKKRGERELEEVSAFFLHKGLPEAAGTSGRDQPTLSGASSLDRATLT